MAGRMVDLAFYSQCSGESFQVPPPIEKCIREKLGHWEWLTLPTCTVPPAMPDAYGLAFLVAVRPTSKRDMREARILPFTSSGCGGGG